MTTYTMNGHIHPPLLVKSKVAMRVSEDGLLPPSRATWRAHAKPEQFSCLESADPNAQLQAALKQVESLLQQNSQLMQTVLLLDHALSDAHSLIEQHGLIGPEDREALHLSPDFHHYMKQLRAQLRARLFG